MSREAFLARVREAARKGRAYRVHLRELPDSVGRVGAGDDLCAAMAAEVEAVGGDCRLAAGWEEARRITRGWLQESKVTTALCWQHAALEKLGLSTLLSELAVNALEYDALAALVEPARRQALLAAGVGITGCDVAIAETGTLLVCSRPGQERLASLLPPVHIAVVEQNRLAADLLDAFSLLATECGGELPSNISLITGPSKTGDIELQLTTGVHGPGKWRVLVVRDEGDR